MKGMGKVTLVGAGPGNGGLLTSRGIQALTEAEVVLADRLVGPSIMALVNPGAEVVDVGKQSGNHTVPQQDINRLIAAYAKAGKRVVRLKGGDPYLFGRGAEELEGISMQGIPFEVVPGIPSALSVPAFAGIPVTHRDYSSSVHIMTGHAKQGHPVELDYSSLVKLNGTLVFLMGFAAMDTILKGLIAAGMAGHTPAALVQQGTMPQQRKLVATVETLAQKVEESGMSSPAVLVVGEVCRLSRQLDWFSAQPLHGKTVLVTRPQTAGSALGDQLAALGCGVIPFPCIHLVERPGALPEELSAYSWIVFTSTCGVEVFFAQLAQQGKDSRSLGGVRLAVIGSRTAKALSDKGLLADYMPDVYDAAHLADGLIEQMKEKEKALLFRAAMGTPELPGRLADKGIPFDDVAAYDTIYRNAASGQIARQLLAGSIDYVTFTSASTVEGFVGAVGKQTASCGSFTGICIGEQTARKAGAHGIKTLTSAQATVASMVETILVQEGKRQ